MLGPDYDVIDSATGEAVIRVRYLSWEEPVNCCICDKPTYSHFCVPYYCGAVRVGHPEAGGAVACEPCYQRWEKWNDTPPAAIRAQAGGDQT